MSEQISVPGTFVRGLITMANFNNLLAVLFYLFNSGDVRLIIPYVMPKKMDQQALKANRSGCCSSNSSNRCNSSSVEAI